MKNTIRGAVAGLAGTAVLVGVIMTLRRVLLTSEQLATAKTHPEKIVERGANMMGVERLDDQTRRRLGDAIHFGYGALWGAALATMTERNGVRPLHHGLALAAGLWAFGFNVLMPVLGVQPGPWTWKRREFVLTISAHTAYGLGTATFLRVLRGR